MRADFFQPLRVGRVGFDLGHAGECLHTKSGYPERTLTVFRKCVGIVDQNKAQFCLGLRFPRLSGEGQQRGGREALRKRGIVSRHRYPDVVESLNSQSVARKAIGRALCAEARRRSPERSTLLPRDI